MWNFPFLRSELTISFLSLGLFDLNNWAVQHCGLPYCVHGLQVHIQRQVFKRAFLLFSFPRFISIQNPAFSSMHKHWSWYYRIKLNLCIFYFLSPGSLYSSTHLLKSRQLVFKVFPIAARHVTAKVIKILNLLEYLIIYYNFLPY